MNDLLQEVFSNGFPQLKKFIALRLGTFKTRDTWTGSLVLRYLHLDMQTEYDYQKLESLCPNLQNFISGGHSFIRIPISTGKSLRRRFIKEYDKLEQLETGDRFLLDYCSWFPERYVESPPRFNNTTTPQPNHPKNVFVLQGRILPRSEPYCAASFLIQITLPEEFPFKTPETRFMDPIYHPHIGANGCGECYFKSHLAQEQWRPDLFLADLINAVILTIDNIDDSSHFIRTDLVDVYRNHRQTFDDNASSSTLTHGRPRY